MYNWQAMLLPQREIVNAIRGSCMHNTGTIFGTNKVGWQDLECVSVNRQIIKHALVSSTDQVATFNCFCHGMLKIAQHRLAQCLSKNQRFVFGFAIAVVNILTDRQREIRR